MNRNGCAGRVLVASAPAPQSFAIGDASYTFHLGFFQLGRTGITAISEFLTPEQDATTAKMDGYFTTSVVPSRASTGCLAPDSPPCSPPSAAAAAPDSRRFHRKIFRSF